MSPERSPHARPPRPATWTSPPSLQTAYVAGWTAPKLAAHYFEWLDQAVPGVSVRRRTDFVSMHLGGSERPAIVLRQVHTSEHHVAFEVVGGFLVSASPGGLFSFETKSDAVTISLSEFTPRLPRPLFLVTHSVAHDLAMSAFCRTLRREVC